MVPTWGPSGAHEAFSLGPDAIMVKQILEQQKRARYESWNSTHCQWNNMSYNHGHIN